MSRSNKRIIAITMGDPQGIGPEVIRKALAHGPLLAHGSFIVIGDKKILGRVKPSVVLVDVPYKTPGEGSLKFLDKAIELVKGGAADAMVTAPLSKQAVSRYHKNFVGHTEYLARAFKVKKFDMMFIAPRVRLTIVTRHVPLRDVPGLITQRAVFNSIALMAGTLKDKFKIKKPKIAVLGLNPHAGEGGLLGSEDVKHILPAIRKARAHGINADGPAPADTFFAFHKPCHCDERSDEAISYDGVIAMYHDQGLAPLKGLYMKELVNFTAGLPFVRTSPAHGTAFDIAGKNKADPSSMLCALKLACQLA
jgi:4-hydroxythreonine-4-phosphate dehydrogenase